MGVMGMTCVSEWVCWTRRSVHEGAKAKGGWLAGWLGVYLS